MPWSASDPHLEGLTKRVNRRGQSLRAVLAQLGARFARFFFQNRMGMEPDEAAVCTRPRVDKHPSGSPTVAERRPFKVYGGEVDEEIAEVPRRSPLVFSAERAQGARLRGGQDQLGPFVIKTRLPGIPVHYRRDRKRFRLPKLLLGCVKGRGKGGEHGEVGLKRDLPKPRKRRGAKP